MQSVTRSLDLLEALAVPDDVALTELARRTGLQPSTAHRLLCTLVERGYVVQRASSGRYTLGYKLPELAAAVGRRTARLRALARPHLESIQKVTRETANLTVLEPPNIVYIDQVEGSRSLRMFTSIGAAVPAHSTAAGKAMLAFVSRDVVTRMLGGEPLPLLTPRTIASLPRLLEELARVRRRGFAIDDEEHELGVACVAAPIRGSDATVAAALSVSAPAQRIHAADPAELGELLIAQAAEVSAALDFVVGERG